MTPSDCNFPHQLRIQAINQYSENLNSDKQDQLDHQSSKFGFQTF